MQIVGISPKVENNYVFVTILRDYRNVSGNTIWAWVKYCGTLISTMLQQKLFICVGFPNKARRSEPVNNVQFGESIG